MTAITTTGFCNTPEFGTDPLPTFYEGALAPVAAGANCRQGGIAVVATSGSAAGYYTNGTAALGLVAMGIFQSSFDNTSGANGATGANTDGFGKLGASVRTGVFPLACGTTTDAITQANVGQPCYIIDNQTVGLTDGAGTRSVAGVIVGMDPAGTKVYVGIGPQFNELVAIRPANLSVATGAATTAAEAGIPFVLRSIFTAGTPGTAGDISIYTANAPFKFRVVDAFCIVTTGIAAKYITLRTATAAGGTAVTSAMSAATSGSLVRNALTTASQTIAAGGSLVIRLDDIGLAGEVFVTCYPSA